MKVAEMSAISDQLIQSGIDVALSDETIEHFTLTEKEQGRLSALRQKVREVAMNNPIIDVSKHNGIIDWTKVRGNVEAAVIRLGYRGYSKGTIAYDDRYKENRTACEQWDIH